MSYGFASHIGAGKQSAFGTAVSASAFFEAMSESMTTGLDRFETRAMTGKYTEADDSTGIQRDNGDIVCAGNPANMGHFLNGNFGTNSCTITASGFLYTTVFTPQQSDLDANYPLPLYTLEIKRAGTSVSSAFRYRDAQFSRIQFQNQPNAALMMTIGVMARQYSQIAASTPTYPGSPVEPFLFDTCSVQLAGSAYTLMESITVTHDNQIEGIPTLNASNLVGHFKRTGPPQVRVSGTFAFTTFSEFNDFINQTERQLILHWTKSNSFSFTIDIPRMVYTAVPISVSGAGRLTADFQGTGRYHTGSANAIKCTLTSVNTF